jgi:hypothetical protein
MSSGNVPHFPEPTDMPPIAKLHIIIILGNTALADILTTQMSTTSNTKYFNLLASEFYI